MLGLRATPTFLVNGRTIAGALPFEQFRDAIEEKRNEPNG
jgi:protein-disulfide isomerase